MAIDEGRSLGIGREEPQVKVNHIERLAGRGMPTHPADGLDQVGNAVKGARQAPVPPVNLPARMPAYCERVNKALILRHGNSHVAQESLRIGGCGPHRGAFRRRAERARGAVAPPSPRCSLSRRKPCPHLTSPGTAWQAGNYYPYQDEGVLPRFSYYLFSFAVTRLSSLGSYATPLIMQESPPYWRNGGKCLLGRRQEGRSRITFRASWW